MIYTRFEILEGRQTTSAPRPRVTWALCCIPGSEEEGTLAPF